MKSATPRWNGPNNSNLGRCVDQCTTNNWLHFQTDGVHIGPSVTSVMPCSVSAELPNKVEMWKLVQVCRINAKGRNISKWVHLNRAEWLVSKKQICHTVTMWLIQGMLLWQLCMYGTSGEKRVVCRDKQVLDHVMWPQHGMTAILSLWPWWPYTFIHSVESTLDYCNSFGPVCFNSLSPSFEGCTSGSHAIALASIVQRPPTPQTAMGTWTPSLACWVAKCSVFGWVPLQHVLQ